MPVPAGTQQHGSACQIGTVEVSWPDLRSTIDHDAGKVRTPQQRQLAQVVGAAVPVCGGIQVGASVRDEADSADGELRSGGVMAPRLIETQVLGDVRLWQPWLGHHAVLDHMTEIDQLHSRRFAYSVVSETTDRRRNGAVTGRAAALHPPVLRRCQRRGPRRTRSFAEASRARHGCLLRAMGRD